MKTINIVPDQCSQLVYCKQLGWVITNETGFGCCKELAHLYCLNLDCLVCLAKQFKKPNYITFQPIFQEVTEPSNLQALKLGKSNVEQNSNSLGIVRCCCLLFIPRTAMSSCCSRPTDQY